MTGAHIQPPPAPGPWALEAYCLDADPEAFFPEKGGSGDPAKRICERCDVSSSCLEYALRNDLREGVWGGLTRKERMRILRRRRRER